MNRLTFLALAAALLTPGLALANAGSSAAQECGLGSWEEWVPGNPEYRTPQTLRSIHSANQGILFNEDQSEQIYSSFQSGDFLYTKDAVVSSSASTITFDLCRTYSPGTASDVRDPPHAVRDDEIFQDEPVIIPAPTSGSMKFDCKTSGWGEATSSPFDFPEGAVAMIDYGKTRIYEDDGVNHQSFEALEYKGHTYIKDTRHKRDTGYSMDYGVCKSK